MPAYAQQRQLVRPRERSFALAAVVLVQLGLAIVLFRGFNVDVTRPGEMIQQLVEVTLAKPPPPLVPIRRTKPQRHQAAAPKAQPAKPGGSPGPQPAHAPPSVAPVIAVKPTAAPSGGGAAQARRLARDQAGAPAATATATAMVEPISSRSPERSPPRDYPRDLRKRELADGSNLHSRLSRTGASGAAR